MNLPNKITVFRFCCIPFLLAASLIQFRYHWVFALLIYFVACMSDKADGIIARKRGLVTDFGKLMDPLSDKSLVLATFLVFVNVGWHTELVIMIMMAREFLVAGIRMAATAEGEVIQANKLGKAKTFCQMSTTGMCFLLLAILSKDSDPVIGKLPQWFEIYVTVAFWFDAAITLISGLKYTKDGWYLIRTK